MLKMYIIIKKYVSVWNDISFLQKYYTINCPNSLSYQVSQTVLS